jgi:polygalacturonase
MTMSVQIGRRAALAVLVALLHCSMAVGQKTFSSDVKKYLTDLPFSMPEVAVPDFSDHRVDIREHGAVADGHTMNTKAFADAIRACAKAGGGTVVVGAGIWLTGPIRLESNINLHLERGALVQFSNRIQDFPFIAGFDGKSKRFMITPPIHAYRSKNIAITGEGIFDGAGEVWRYVKKDKLTQRQWNELTSSGGVVSSDGKEWWPSKEAMDGEEYIKELEKSKKALTASDYAKTREYLRPDLLRFAQCEGILLDGPTFQNSPKFHVHLVQSENIIVRNVKILAEWYAQNGDGLDINSCRNVVVYNTTVNVGDDGICLKPGNIAGTQKPGPACENIVIADCIVYRAHGGFVIGSESFGGARNVSVRNCIFAGTDIGIRFKSLRGRGGLVENIFVDGIQMRAIVNEAVLIDMYYGGGAPEVEATKNLNPSQAEPVTDQTPRFQNISIKNIVCNGVNRAVFINGLPEMPVKNITLENISVASKLGVFCTDAEGISFNQCRILPRLGAVMTLAQSRNITVKGGTFPDSADAFLKVAGEKSGNITIVGIDLTKFKKTVELGEGARPEAVTYK